MKRLFRKITRKFTVQPEAGFTWSVEDFERAKRWAKSQDDPDNPKRSLWDRVYSPRKESTEILHELNMMLGA